MLGSSKIKLDPDLLRKVRMYARIAEAPSVEAFVTQALQKQLARLDEEKKRQEGGQ